MFALQSVWVKTGALQWWRNWKPHKWMDVRVALEQFTGSDGMRDSILFIYYMYHEEKKVCAAADPGRAAFAKGNSFFKGGNFWNASVLRFGNQFQGNPRYQQTTGFSELLILCQK